ncbi:MAG: ABC transporter permease [Prolixibacteraceae bacterium]|nr:ABC transporter permease [Prolixibacteraceae bacterium]
MLFIRLFLESFRFAYNSLVVNQLRTFLSLLGITIGIFCIISVFTIIDSLERTIRNSMEKLGSNVVYVQKWPWAPPPGETDYPWWKYLNRPVPKFSETLEIRRRSNLAQNVVFYQGFNRTVQFGTNKAENVVVLGGSSGLIETWGLKIAFGRPLSEEELDGYSNLGMMGSELAAQLFPGSNAVGRSVKIQGFNILIVGVFEKMGEDMFGTSMDNRVLIPVKFAYRMVDPKMDAGQSIIVKGKVDIVAARLMEELEGIMRSIHRIKPSEENDFALNEVSLISGRLDGIFKVLNIAGWIIGGFSILVGGFGIANIMFVSVKERTKIIGIQKAMGAKYRFILLEFLFEATVLSLIGGLIGLFIIYLGTYIAKASFDFEFVLTAGNIATGLIISISIGLIAGLVPARSAAKLDPVTAMNSL